MKKNQNNSKNFIQKLRVLFQDSGSSLSLVIALVIIGTIWTFTTKNNVFLTPKNITNILVNSSIVTILAVGLTVPMLLGGIDVSQYAIAALTAMVAGILLEMGWPAGLAVLGAVLAGALCGVLNGVLFAYLKINAIITTIGTMQVFRALSFILMNGNTIMIGNKSFLSIGRYYVFDAIPITVIIMMVVMVTTYYMLNYTSIGRKVYAVGGNEYASNLSGIDIAKIKFFSLIYSGACAAIAGVLLSAQIGAGIPSSGSGNEMSVIAAVILGGISLTGGKGNVWGTILGVLVLATITNGMALMSIPSFYQMFINGVALIIAVFIDLLRNNVYKRRS